MLLAAHSLRCEGKLAVSKRFIFDSCSSTSYAERVLTRPGCGRIIQHGVGSSVFHKCSVLQRAAKPMLNHAPCASPAQCIWANSMSACRKLLGAQRDSRVKYKFLFVLLLASLGRAAGDRHSLQASGPSYIRALASQC